MKGRQQQRAFTLIEVLVALVIVAFGMGALLATLSSAADTTMHLREKSFAEWVALNHISEIRLRGVPPTLGKSAGEVDFAQQKWRWSQAVLDPGIAGIRRIDVSVSHAEDLPKSGQEVAALATATGFIGLAVAPPSGIEPDWSLWSSSSAAASATAAPGATPTPGATATTGSPGATPASEAAK